MSETIFDAPIFDPAKRKEKHLVAKWLFVGAAALGGVVGVDGAVHLGERAASAIETSIKTNNQGPSLTKGQEGNLTKEYVVRPGNTVWSIASAEGPAIADNPEALYEAQNSIDAQIPGKNPANLAVGEEIRLPANSAIGAPIKKS